MKYRIFILLIGYFLFTASTCEKPFDIDSVDDPKLVLSCVFTPDKPFAVSLEQSRPILDPVPRSLFGATVEIIEPDGNIIPLNFESRGLSKWFVDSTFYPEAEIEYTVKAAATNFEPIFANNIIPTPVEVLSTTIHNFRTERSSTELNKSDCFVDCEIQLEDKSGEHYYHLYVSRQKVEITTTNQGEDEFQFFDEYIDNELMTFNNPNGLVYSDNSLLFKDEGDISPNVSFEVGFIYSPVSEAIKKLRFELRTVSRAYYLFHVSKRKQELIAQDQFAEPIISFNNIEGGLGLFGGYSSIQIDTISVN